MQLMAMVGSLMSGEIAFNAISYEKVPRKMASVHCVTRSLEKLTMMRGENWIDASVSVISRMANTMETTVMMEAAMPARMTWATCGSACEGKRAVGTRAGSRKLLFQTRQEYARATQRQGDCERAHQKAATQVIHGVTKY
jgi:hypothetical protein